MRYLQAFGLAAVLAAGAIGSATAADLEKSEVSLGVGGKSALYYLPLTIAEQKGYFEEEGIELTINDFKGGSQSLQALVGGSVDVVTGAYEHTIRMQAKGQDIVAVIELGRFPGITVAVKSELKDEVKTAGDLKGKIIGVTAPGSSTHNVVNYALGKDGVKPDEVSIIGVGVGQTVLAAVKNAEVDAISNIEPSISALVRDGSMFVLVDTRTEEGTKALFGGTNPAAVLYLTRDFMEENPNTTQALVNALYKALKFLETATPEEIAETVPEEYWYNDKELYLEATRNSLEAYSRTGMITEEGMEAAMELLSFDEALDLDAIDVSKTYEGSFVEKASGM